MSETEPLFVVIYGRYPHDPNPNCPTPLFRNRTTAEQWIEWRASNQGNYVSYYQVMDASEFRLTKTPVIPKIGWSLDPVTMIATGPGEIVHNEWGEVSP